VSLERWIRLIAGTFVVVSVALSYLQSRYWLLFTLFVGLNLFQSALTRWCLMENILRKLGVGRQAASPAPIDSARARS
jgi:Inner membrane protein YgaP-like, transmembrane domain